MMDTIDEELTRYKGLNWIEDYWKGDRGIAFFVKWRPPIPEPPTEPEKPPQVDLVGGEDSPFPTLGASIAKSRTTQTCGRSYRPGGRR